MFSMDPSLANLLSDAGLEHLRESMAKYDGSLQDLKALLANGRTGFMGRLKDCGMELMSDRQALAAAVSKSARGKPLTSKKEQQPPLLDARLACGLRQSLLTPESLRAPGFERELQPLPALGESSLLPGESAACTRPAAKAR